MRKTKRKDIGRVSAVLSQNPSVDCSHRAADFSCHKSHLCDSRIYFTSFIKRRLTAVAEIFVTDFPSKNLTGSQIYIDALSVSFE